MLSVIMLSVIMLSDVMLSVVLLSVVMLNVIMLNVIMLNVMAPITAELEWLSTCIDYHGKKFYITSPKNKLI